MSAFPSMTEAFDGLRSFPREPEQLLHHLSRVNHALQTKYYIAPEIAEFALQPDKSADFEKFYQKEIEQIINHLNKSTRQTTEVRVDATRYASGFELVGEKQGTSSDSRHKRQHHHHHLQHGSTSGSRRHGSGSRRGSRSLDAGQPTATASQREADQNRTDGGVGANWQELLGASARKLADKESAARQCALAAAAAGASDACSPSKSVATTPVYAVRRRVEDLQSTGGATMIDSTARPQKDSFLFTTPPEFHGFTNGPGYSPSGVSDRSPADR